MIKKRGFIVATTMATAALLAPIASPASATVTGAVGFHCTATIEAFPSVGSPGTCEGETLPAFSAAVAAGVDDNGFPYALGGVGSFRASFKAEQPCIANEPPLAGAVTEGKATARHFTAVRGAPSTTRATANATFEFEWLRVGAALVILTSKHEVTFDNGDTATGTAPGAAVGTFAPILQANNLCPSGGQVKALVTAAAVVPV